MRPSQLSLRGAVRSPKAVHTRTFCVERSSGQADSSSAATSKIADEESEKGVVGRIDIIVGPMFAGKTSELLRRVEQHEAAGRKVAVVKSSVDTRYHATRVVSHDGKSKVCFAASNLRELRNQLGDEYHEYSVFAIDEAQFLPDLLEFCTTAADVDRKHIVVAGLDGDFKRQRFGQVLDIVSVADSVTKLAGKCAYCDKQALFSLRIAADERQALVGGADKYAPVCRHHYVSLNNVRTLDL
ncbi:g9812 [Coccomyxa elongata]